MAKGRKSQEERKPPSGDTPRVEEFPQPARRGGEDVLPIVAIGSVDLEKLCRGLLRVEYPNIVRSELKRGRGVAQFGVDVEGFDATQAPVVVVSCKCYRDVHARDLLPWTKEFTQHLESHWKDKGVKVFVLAVTCDGNDDDINDAARNVASHLNTFGIGFDLWTTQKMSDLARKDLGLIDVFFGSYWQEAFSPHGHNADVIAARGTAAASVGSSIAIAALSKEVTARLSERDRVIVKRLDEAQTAFRAGRVTIFKTCIDEVRGNPSVWETLDGEIRAKTARARALVTLYEGDAAGALNAIDEADGYAAPADRSLRAAVLRAIQGAEAALAYLGQANSEREHEVKASLLLELAATDKALAELDRVPADRVEIRRLRAIAYCQKGDRDQAVTLADGVRNADPHSAVAQQTLGILHTMAALSTRSETQFGSMPNPIDPGLVRGTQDALDHLAAAEGLFRNLAATLERPAKEEAEIWRLASLILHPDRRADARELARELLAREAVEPLAIAWCRLTGLPFRHGHMRKLLGDALRQGRGSPSHIVVNALLAADKDGPAAGASVVERHAALFPKAGDFLEGWRKRFAGGGEDDDPLLVAMSVPNNARRFAELASSILSRDYGDDAVLTSAEVMAGSGAWPELFSIQARLTTVRTPRAIVIAGHAAFNSGRPDETLRVLDEFRGCFRDGKLPPSLLDLKARAHDALGDKRRAIAGLEQVVAQTNSPQARRRLVDAYLGVGNLGSARHHAEQFIFQTSADPVEAVALAEVWKSTDPNFSRRLVVHAASDPRFPVHAAPHAFSLAVQLGLKDVEASLAPIVFDVEKYGTQTGVIALDSVEALITHMNARAEDIRQRFSEWLEGRQWSHATWSNDVRTFSMLYLGEAADRKDSIGQSVPMLLNSAGVERAPRELGVGKPILIMDISALLLAARLQLIDALSRIFFIKIPASTARAIMEMEDALLIGSEATLTAARAVLSDASIGLRMSDEVPDDAVPLAIDGDPSMPRSDVLAKVLNEAVSQGRLSRRSAEATAAEFGFQLDGESLAGLPSGLGITANLAVRLAECGVLEAVCRTVEMHWTAKDRGALVASLAQDDRIRGYRRTLECLRKAVAEKLQKNGWAALPKRLDEQWEKRRKTMRPHVLCLAEVAGAVESDVAGLYWIEDRLAQRSPDPRLVGITQVLQRLTETGEISVADREGRELELRRIGYAFQTPDLAAMLRDVLAAPIAQEQLIESPELEGWRTWFAGQVELLQYCGRPQAPDTDGRITGEGRHLLDIMGVARETLWAIWRRPDEPDVDKMVRSGWVWTNLRIEQMPFFPVVQADAAGATMFVALNVAHIADLPLLALVQGDEAAKGPARLFLPWFFRVIVDPRCGVDPEFRTHFVAQMARTIVAMLGWADENSEETEREAVRAYMRRQVSEYLDLMPDEWRERLLGEAELAEQLQVRPVLTAHLGDFELDAVDLGEILAARIPSVEPSGELTQEIADRDGKKLSLRIRGNGQDLPSVIIEAGHNVLSLDPVIVAMHHPDRAQRSKGVVAAGGGLGLDGPSEERSQKLEGIAALHTVGDRIKGLRTLQEKDFSLTCKRVREAVHRRRPVAFSDLTLPEPGALQAYLRMTAEDVQAMEGLPDRIFGRLLADLAPDEAIARLAGSPFRPSEESIARIGAVVSEAAGVGAVQTLRLDTGLEALTYLRGCRDKRADAFEPVVERVLELVVEQEPLFIALLTRAARRAERDASWAQLPHEVAALLTWVWADRLTAALVTGGAEPKGAAKMIAADELGLADIVERGMAPGWWRETVRKLDDGRLLAGVAGEVVGMMAGRQISAGTHKRVLETGGRFFGDAWMPRPDASFPPETGPAGYWPAEDVVAKVAASGATGIVVPFNIRVPDDYVRGLLGSEVGDEQLPGVLGVLSFIDVARLTAERADHLRESVIALLARGEVNPGNPGYRRGVGLMAATLAVTGTPNDGKALIEEHARRLAAKWPEAEICADVFERRTEDHQGVTLLIEMVLAFAHYRNEPLADKLHWIASATEMIATAWPKSTRGVLTFLDRSIARLPVRDATPLWATFNRLRTLP